MADVLLGVVGVVVAVTVLGVGWLVVTTGITRMWDGIVGRAPMSHVRSWWESDGRELWSRVWTRAVEGTMITLYAVLFVVVIVGAVAWAVT